MRFLKDIQRMAAKAAREAEAQQRKLIAQHRKFLAQQQREERAYNRIVEYAARMVEMANESLRIAADKTVKVPTRIKRLDKAKNYVGNLKQQLIQYPFLTLPTLHEFEKDIARIEQEIYKKHQDLNDQQFVNVEKKQHVKAAKIPKISVQRKAKDIKPKPVIFKYDSSFESLRLPRTKQ